MKHIAKLSLCLLLVVLLAAAALTGCTEKTPSATEAPQTEAPAPQTEAPKTEAPQTEAPQTEAPQTEAPQTEAPQTEAPETEAPQTEPKLVAQELGEGATVIYFDVTFQSGETSSYVIHTDAATVGEALLGLDLIAGDESEYGLYVKTVCDETLDWDAHHMYWAFFENGEYAMTGVDSTAVTDGNRYAFVATAG